MEVQNCEGRGVAAPADTWLPRPIKTVATSGIRSGNTALFTGLVRVDESRRSCEHDRCSHALRVISPFQDADVLLML
jgi:hypothetical protein